jgi:transposase-like protein
MKCSNPNCNRGIGLVSHQRSSFDKQRFCSKKCRDNFVKEKSKPLRQECLTPSYFEWLLSRSIPNPRAQATFLRYSLGR